MRFDACVTVFVFVFVFVLFFNPAIAVVTFRLRGCISLLTLIWRQGTNIFTFFFFFVFLTLSCRRVQSQTEIFTNELKFFDNYLALLSKAQKTYLFSLFDYSIASYDGIPALEAEN